MSDNGDSVLEKSASSNQPTGRGCAWVLLLLCVAGALAAGLYWRFYRTPETAGQFGPGGGGPGAAAARSGGPGEGKGLSKDAGGGAPSGKALEAGHRPSASGGAPGGFGGMNRVTPVAVATAQRGDLPLYLDAPGTVIAVNTSVMRTRIDGQIMKINFQEGQLVQTGDLLLEVDPRPYEAALSQAKANLAKVKADVEQARAALAKDQAQARNARAVAERDVALLAKGMVSKEECETARSQADALDAAIKADEANIQSAVEAVASGVAAVETAKLQLSYCHISAPISGRIGLRLVDLGNMVRAADASGFAVITQLEPMTVAFSLAQDNLPRIMAANGEGNTLVVEAWNRDRTLKIASGTLMAVDSQIDLTTLTIKMKAIFDNKDHALFPNQAVNVRLLVETKKDTVLLPAQAVQHSPQTDFVYIVKDDAVEMRPIKVGPVEGDKASVAEGLTEGEVVVTDGVDKLENGSKVTVPGSEPPPGEGGHRGKSGEGNGAPQSDGPPGKGTASGADAQPAGSEAQKEPGRAHGGSGKWKK